MPRENLYEKAMDEGYGIEKTDENVSLVRLETGERVEVARKVEGEWQPVVAATFAQDFAKGFCQMNNRRIRAEQKSIEKSSELFKEEGSVDDKKGKKGKAESKE